MKYTGRLASLKLRSFPNEVRDVFDTIFRELNKVDTYSWEKKSREIKSRLGKRNHDSEKTSDCFLVTKASFGLGTNEESKLTVKLVIPEHSYTSWRN